MQKLNDLSRSLTALEQDGTLITVIEMSLSSWLVAGIVPGVERQPLKKLAVDETALLKLLHRWREEAEKAGRTIERIAIAFEAGRDGFWLARWLKARGIEAYVIHASSVAVSREHRRAKIVSTPSCSNAPFSAGYAASVITARWSRSRR
jgi:transposase